MPKKIAKEHEHHYARHVLLHTRQARFDAEKALEALPPQLPVHRELTQAVTHLRSAERTAERWYRDVMAAQEPLFGEAGTGLEEPSS